MMKGGKWLRSFFTGKKEKEKEEKEYVTTQSYTVQNKPMTPIQVPSTKEKRRWSFRRSVMGTKDIRSSEMSANAPTNDTSFSLEIEQKRHALAVAAATAAAAGAAVAAAQAAAAAIPFTSVAKSRRSSSIEEAAAIKIQSVFRSFLARKALRALRGLVKLQALVRGHLLRKQARTTLRCMRALLTAQARARYQRMQLTEEAYVDLPRQTSHRRSPQDPRCEQYYEKEGYQRSTEDSARVVEMDLGEPKTRSNSRTSYYNMDGERTDNRFAEYYGKNRAPYKIEHQQFSPAPSGITDMSPRTCSAHFEDFSFATAQSSPQCLSAVSHSDAIQERITVIPQHATPYSISHDYPLYPNYMANTQSSIAKARSQSAPKQRPETYERQSSRRRLSVEGRNNPKGIKMQRSSSQVNSTVHEYSNYPWFLKMDRSSMSVRESDCGSTSTANTNFLQIPSSR